MAGLEATALLLVLCSAAASLILALPVAVAAESLTHYPLWAVRRFWLIVNTLPLVAGCLLTAAAFAFQLGDITATPHQDRLRPHLCLQSLTDLPDAAFRFQLYAVLALALLLYAVVRFVLSLRASQKTERIIGRLLADEAEEGGELPPVILPLAEPDCFSLGLTRPVVMMTSGLSATLSQPEVDAVLAHERCHVRYRDNALELLLRLLSDPLIWLPTTHYYAGALRATVEQFCDATAAEQTSPADLASALEKMTAAKEAQQEKLQGDLAALRPLFPTHASPATRIAALVGEKYSSLALPLPVILGLEAAIVLGASLWLARPLHDTLYCAAHSLLAVFRM